MFGEIPPLLTNSTARRIMEGAGSVSLDLGLSETTFSYDGSWATLGYGGRISRVNLEKIASREGAVFFPEGDGVYQVAVTDGRHHFKLLPTTGAPTLEIDGVRMHRTMGTDPWADARQKLTALDLRGGRVLDTCMGLGYTAIGSLERGAEAVVSIERQVPVFRIAQMNPWSRRLSELQGLFHGDAFLTVDSLPNGFFDWVVHDPPRLTHAGELYSGEFYTKLLRVMAAGGRLFHYTGVPGSRHRGVDLQRGVQRRLRAAGFRNTEYHTQVMGVTCEK
jgi:predicted methyltransferase